MIEIQDVSVHFRSRHRTVKAVDDVSLTIKAGTVFGIVGTSGAGKSTLLRTINLLERPTTGRVVIDGQDITRYVGEELRRTRLGIGMIFQHFNLIHAKTVSDNVGFAMKVAGRPQAEIGQRVSDLLALVGLTDKAGVYPAKLSGGQKQRVGIARALANRPQILLCDEPTSALDLETTGSILALLKEINRNFGITIVLISHEMAVIKQVCDHVAVMDQGKIVEVDDVYEIFAHPRHEFTRQLISRTLNLDLPERLLRDVQGVLLKIVYRGERAEDPILAETVRRFGVEVNILHGKIEYIGGRPIGVLIVATRGEAQAVERAVAYLREQTAEVEVLRG